MANLPEDTLYDAGVYQIETVDPVVGGVNGISNKAARNLANRTNWLKNAVDFLSLQKANLLSPNFAGTPSAPTAAVNDNSTRIATTAFVNSEIAQDRPWGDNALSLQMNGAAYAGLSGAIARLDHVHPTDVTRAPLASPNFSGSPQADTAAVGTATRQIASTQFVVNEIGNARPFEASPINIKTNGTQAVGTNNTVARGDHVHPTDATRAPVNSPTLTGTPLAPTAAVNTNTAQIATTAFVNSEIAADRPFEDAQANIKMNGVQAVGTNNTVARGDHSHPIDTSRAPVNNPTFTGIVDAPTPAAASNNTNVITSAWAKLSFFHSYNISGAMPSIYFVFTAPYCLIEKSNRRIKVVASH